MEAIITIDIGTTAAKIIAFDLKGKEITRRKGTYPIFHSQPDYSEQDPEQVFITVLFVLKGLLNDPTFFKKRKAIAIVFSSSMHSVLPIDKNGVPLGNAIIWADNRARKEAEELKNSSFGAEIYKATGTPIHPMSPLAKITWIKNHEPERFSKTSKFISLKEYILCQFTGEYVIDYSLASATGLFNIHNLTWESKSLDFAGINSNHLSTPMSVLTSELKIRPELAKSLRLADKTKLIIGSSDGCSATLSSGVVGQGQAIISITSSGAVRVAGENVLDDEKQRFFNYILDKGHYISGGPTNNGGVAIEWFARQFGNFNNGLDYEEALVDLFKDAAQVKAGANGLLFLPYILGERAPIWNANARGVYFGINITHEPQHFVRATIEGILFEIYSIGKLLQQYRNIDNLYVNGTFATVPLWSQIISDIFGKAVNVNDNTNSANAGAALLALTEIGVFKNLREAARSVHSSKIYQPNLENHHTYQKFYKVFEQLSYKLEAEFDLIAQLQQNQDM